MDRKTYRWIVTTTAVIAATIGACLAWGGTFSNLAATAVITFTVANVLARLVIKKILWIAWHRRQAYYAAYPPGRGQIDAPADDRYDPELAARMQASYEQTMRSRQGRWH